MFLADMSAKASAKGFSGHVRKKCIFFLGGGQLPFANGTEKIKGLTKGAKEGK